MYDFGVPETAEVMDRPMTLDRWFETCWQKLIHEQAQHNHRQIIVAQMFLEWLEDQQRIIWADDWPMAMGAQLIVHIDSTAVWEVNQ